jgi:hypothetical protein
MRHGVIMTVLLLGIGGAHVPSAFGGGPAWEVAEAEGDLFVLPADEVDWRMAGSSDLLQPGDRLWAAPAGRAVVRGPEGLLARLDRQTQIEFIRSNESRPTLALLSGALYLKHSALGRKRVEFDLQSGRTLLRSEEATMARVETLEDGALAVAVYKGEVRIVTDADSAWIRAGEMTEVTRTAAIRPPESIRLAQRDDFDQWNEAQELRLAKREPSAYADEPDLAQLDGYGDWMQVSGYGRVWQPRVAIGWQPYFYGQWVWVSSFGWNWVAAEPWGWLPSHYGQWVWDGYYGWVWAPGSIWAPAWVIWAPYQGGWAWAPYGPFGIPVSIAWRYWCWAADVGGPGWRVHRPVGSVPPIIHHRGPSEAQPPHRVNGDRERNIQLPSAMPVRAEEGTLRHRTDTQRDAVDRLAPIQRVNRRPADSVSTTINQDSNRAAREGAGQGEAVRDRPGRTVRPAQEARDANPGRDGRDGMDRFDRNSRQKPAVRDEPSARMNRSISRGEIQPERRTQVAEGPAVRAVPRMTGSRPSPPSAVGSSAPSNPGRQFQASERPSAANPAPPSGGFSGRTGAAASRFD